MNENSYTFTKEVKEYSLIPEGDYEVRIEKAERKTLSTGKEKLTITYVVRQDVEQECKNRYVFEDIWQEKDNPQFFNRKRLNQLLGTQDIKEGTTFADINEVLDFLWNQSLIVHIGQSYDDYRQKDVNYVSYYKSSQHLPQKLGSTATTTKVEITDDELPF